MSSYITTDQLKDTLEIGDGIYADEDIEMACAAAQDVIEGYKQTRYYPTTETRTYTPPLLAWPWRGNSPTLAIPIDDLNGSTAVAVTVDMDGDGVYETTWTQGTDYYLEPQNAAADAMPWDTLVLRLNSGRTFPSVQHSVKITGSFGWEETPDRVRQAAKILAARYLKRARETPYGILTVIGDAVAAARLGKIDPDVAALIDNQYGLLPTPWL